MYNVTAGFKTFADDRQQIPQKRFTFPEGGTDRTDKLLHMGSFEQKQFEGDELTSSDLEVLCLNDTKEFNFLLSSKDNIGNIGKLELGFAGEYINRYRGYLESVEFFTDVERAKCRLRFTSKAQRAIERTLGSQGSPIDYTAARWNPGDLAWELLTVRAGLDATTSTANVDIDYTSWLAFKNICDQLLISFHAYFTGETIAEGLRVIGQLTDALIYGETDGKIYFKKFIPSETAATAYTFTEANAHIQAGRVYFNKARLINKVTVWFGYDPLGEFWAGSAPFHDSVSQANYGLAERTFDSPTVWHVDLRSATSFGERVISKHKDPIETIEFQTEQGTQAIIHQLADNFKVTWSQLDYSNKVFKLYGLGSDLSEQSYTLMGEYDKYFNQAFFILNSATHGILGTSSLF